MWVRPGDNVLDEPHKAFGILLVPGQPATSSSYRKAVGEQEDTIQDVYEPFLMRRGLLERTSRGRTITAQGLAAVQDLLRPDGDGAGQQKLL